MLPYGSASGHKAPSREEKRREEKRREEKRTPFRVNLIWNQVLYRAAQDPAKYNRQNVMYGRSVAKGRQHKATGRRPCTKGKWQKAKGRLRKAHPPPFMIHFS